MDLCATCRRPFDGPFPCTCTPLRRAFAMPDPVAECIDCGRDFTPDDPDAEYCPRCDDSGDDL